MSQPLRILVVDDHALFRRGLVGLLSEMPGIEVIGEAADGADAIRQVAALAPDFVLMDVNMPNLSGVRAVEEIRKVQPKLPILMLTISQADDDLIGAIVAGANGYLLKSAEPELLYRTILQVADGHAVLSPEVTARVLQVVQRGYEEQKRHLLSERELEVLRCLAQGMTTSMISSSLYISENTVKTHVRHILEKLEVNNRTEAVARASQLQLL
ncbi:MAG: response regulator transcription factor [Anaerolineales bacterium]